MTSQYYKECHGIILVYDVTNKQSLENCQNWINDVREHNKSDIELLLLANKIDLADKREVKLEDGEKFAMLNKMKFLEVSALTNSDQCVNKGFLMIIKEITEKLIQSRNMKDKSEPS
jgi:GTPase SAR1 family protein